MPQDAFTLRHLCLELNNVFVGGKVNRIVQIDENRVYLTVFTGKNTKKLLLDVNPGSPKIAITAQEPSSPLTAPNFCMLLRKHLLSATLDGISLVGYDRIVRVDFTSSPEFFDSVQKTLFVELMGRYSNIILTENGKVLGANRCLNLMDVARPIIVYKPYVLPPNQDKLQPNDQNLLQVLSDFSAEKDGDFIVYLAKKIQGLAISTVEQCLFEYCRETGKTKEEVVVEIASNSQPFFRFIQYFMYQKKASPCVVEKDGVPIDVMAFPYSRISGEIKRFEYLYLAEDYFHTVKDKAKEFSLRKERAKNLVNSAIKKSGKKLSQIKSREKDSEDAELNRIKGELIIANLYRIEQGQEFCELENYYDDGKVIKIALDKRLTPQRNAENYFKRYNKQKRTLVAIIPQKEDAEREIEYLKSLLQFVERAESVSDLEGVYEELTSLGLIRATPLPKGAKKQERSFREYVVQGFTVRVGRSNTENDRLLKGSRGDCIWLHAKDYHSSHVVIESNGKEVPIEVIVICGEICAFYSPLRDSGSGEIVYTQKKNVKKPQGAKAGFVTYEDYRSVTVSPNKNEKYLK